MLCISVGTALIAARGYAAPDVEQAYARARKLCQHVGETPQLFPVLRGLWAFYLVRAEYSTAHELAEQLLTLAQHEQDPTLLMQAHGVLGMTMFYLGEFLQAPEHFAQGIALYDPAQHHSLAFVYGEDPGVILLAHLAWTLWFLGYPDRALQRSQEALALAQELSHPHSVALALTFAAHLDHFRRESQAAQERAEAAIALCTEHGFPFWLAMGSILRGWALAEQGQREEGIAQMRQGLAGWQATGAKLSSQAFRVIMADACGKVGQAEAGMTALVEARALGGNNGDRLWEGELHRVKGEVLLQCIEPVEMMLGAAEAEPFDSAQDEAEACFRQAIEVARQQQARSLELWATMSLCRLWQAQGKREEAQRLLAEVYGWFTEGFDTPDLKKAKALLDALHVEE